VDGALWTNSLLDETRVQECPPLIRIVVAIDPAVTSKPDSDETGIVVAGVTSDGHYYILEDVSLRAGPDAWARKAVEAYYRWKADRIIGEGNNGGDMIESLLRQVDPLIPYKKVTATRGKLLRAEPVASLYEQNRAHHVGSFAQLEDQMTNYTPLSDFSPDRLDALVWAMTDLMEGASSMLGIAALAQFCPSCRMPAPKTAKFCPTCHTALG
jgi:phage terminase large subunit-like protein